MNYDYLDCVPVGGDIGSGIQIAVIPLENPIDYMRGHAYILKADGTLYKGTVQSSDGVIVDVRVADDILAKITPMLLPDDKIVEIAAQGNELAIRVSNGECFWISPPVYSGDDVKIKKIDSDVLRVTPNNTYKSKSKYIKSGAGTAPLIPLIEDDIISVYTLGESDIVVRVDDVIHGNSIGTLGNKDIVVDTVTGLPSIEGVGVFYDVSLVELIQSFPARMVKTATYRVSDAEGAGYPTCGAIPHTQQEFLMNVAKFGVVPWAGYSKYPEHEPTPFWFLSDEYQSITKTCDAPASSRAEEEIRKILAIFETPSGVVYYDVESEEVIEPQTKSAQELIQGIYDGTVANSLILSNGSVGGADGGALVGGSFITYDTSRFIDIDLSKLEDGEITAKG